MSDEIHIEAAFRHVDKAALTQWHSAAPDQECMEAEEWDPSEEPPDRVKLWEAMMVYLFADAVLSTWENVAWRAFSVMRHCTPGLLFGRSESEVGGIWQAARRWEANLQRGRYPLNVFKDLSEEEEYRKWLIRLMDYIYPNEGKRWLYKGTQRAYMLARQYQPGLVRQDGRELAYQDFARIFEGDPLETEKARDRARSRWSARAKAVLRTPLETQGTKVHLQFGKSERARAAMSQSAAGNQNRKGKRKAKGL